MVYRKITQKKRTYKKKLIRTPYRKSTTKKLVRLIKKVSLKQSETKNSHMIQENNQLNHNGIYVMNSLLALNQGVSDTQAGSQWNACRIGDQVLARGLSIKLWIANKLDRPNVMYRIVVYKYQSRITPGSDTFLNQGATNIMLRDFNLEKYSIVKTKTFNVQLGFSAFPSGSVGDQDGREAHKLVSFWIPLKNKKIEYEEGATIPKWSDYGIAIMAYDSYGTLTTDNIASFAINYKFYFKDP